MRSNHRNSQTSSLFELLRQGDYTTDGRSCLLYSPLSRRRRDRGVGRREGKRGRGRRLLKDDDEGERHSVTGSRGKSVERSRKRKRAKGKGRGRTRMGRGITGKRSGLDE